MAAAVIPRINYSLRIGWVNRSFRGMRSMNPESKDYQMCNCTFEVRADARPGMILQVNSD
jgi:hypothetical protein